MKSIGNLFNPSAAGIPSLKDRLTKVRRLLVDADYVIIGAGAGLSAAAGLEYAGEEFQREFRPWIEHYGITDLYSSSFYPFGTEEEYWAYWAKHIWFARYRTDVTLLYSRLLELVKRKRYFVITTNVDGQFEKTGFDRKRIFATQGDYAFFQSRTGRSQKLYDNKEWIERVLPAINDCRIPTELIPCMPGTGEPLSPHLRCDDTFVEDAHWHRQAKKYRLFVEEASKGRLLLLEFGVGFNTPSIIRFPFERMAFEFSHAALVRFNRDYPQPIVPGLQRFTSFTEDLSRIIRRLEY